jgi:hypothetical protein
MYKRDIVKRLKSVLADVEELENSEVTDLSLKITGLEGTLVCIRDDLNTILGTLDFIGRTVIKQSATHEQRTYFKNVVNNLNVLHGICVRGIGGKYCDPDEYER